jgi:hypothetical protein
MIRRFEFLALFSAVLLVSIPLGPKAMAQTIAPNGRIVFESDPTGTGTCGP